VSCPDENQLVLLVEGAIQDRAALDRHFDGCVACSALVAELARLAAPVRAAPDRYRIIRQLGAGAMGVVWEAEDRSLGRRVALKWIHPDGVADRERRARLQREARALAQLRHPNVVAVYDVGKAGDELYLALELVVGTTARDWRSRPDRPAATPGEILALWCQVGAGLAAVHRAGIVHRDVKPDNVLVADDGRVLIGDFGLATGDLGDSALELTTSGQLLGTPLYMAPEQLRGEAATAQSDQFALCVCLWEALAGRRPFIGGSIAALAVAMVTPPVMPSGVAGVDRAVFAVLARGLDPDPARRWPDVTALVDALATRPSSGRRRVRLGIAVALVLGGGAVTWQATWPASEPAPAPVGAALVAPAGAASLGVAAPADAVLPGVSAPVDAALPGVSAPADTALARTARSSSTPLGVRGSSDRRPSPPAVAAISVTTARPRGEAPADVSPGETAAVGAVRAQTPVLAPPDASESGYVVPEWHLTENRASDLLRAGDGAGCLRELAGISPVPSHVIGDIEALRAQCTMRAGDCPGGRAVFGASLRASGVTPDRVEPFVDLMDFQYCALDAPPAAKWPARAWAQLREALASKRSCKPVLDFIEHHQLQIPAPANDYAVLRLECAVRDGNCAEARVHWRHLTLGDAAGAQQAEREAAVDRQFEQKYSSCAR